MVIFWRTGVHQETHNFITFSPLGVPRGGPEGWGHTGIPSVSSPLGTPKPRGAQFRCAKWTFQSRPQGRPPKGPSAQPRTPGAGRRPRTTPECHLTPYNSVSGPSMVIFWRTGVHQKTHVGHIFTPGGPPGWPWGRGQHPNPPGPPRPSPGPARPKWPGEQFRHAKWRIYCRAQGGPPNAPSVRPGRPGAGRHYWATAECCSTPYNSVSGSGMVIFWRTGVRQENLEFCQLVTAGVAKGWPWGGDARTHAHPICL